MAIDRIKIKRAADQYLASGKVERAIEELRKLLEDNPKDLNTMNQIGDLCIQIGRLAEGVELHKRLGAAYERDGFHSKAAAVFPVAVYLLERPDQPEILWVDALVAAAIIWFHRANIKRLLQGTENRFRRRAAPPAHP